MTFSDRLVFLYFDCSIVDEVNNTVDFLIFSQTNAPNESN